MKVAKAGELRLLYVAPERFASEEFMRLLGTIRVARFVVDEAHCVSAWGHDFRPDYRRLKAAAAACRRVEEAPGRPPVSAFTATATPEVRKDIVDLLGLMTPQVLVAGFDRPNIHLSVRPVEGDLEKHELLPSLVADRRALVYASTRKTAEAAAATLQGARVQAAAYHAGLEDKERTRVQDGFADGSIRVVCATNAFGMGIDRPDVEAVVHVAIPGSIEAYYQEIGRAGRDGRRATATLLWDPQDVHVRQFLIDSPRQQPAGRTRAPVDPEEAVRHRAIEHSKLDRMVGYADATTCLRATILRYFGDPAAREPCGACGNCRSPGVLDPHDRETVRKILSGIARAGQRYGRRRITAMLHGDVEDLPPSLTSLSTIGLLRHERPEAIGQWIDAAISGGLVTISGDRYRILGLTPLGRDVVAGRTEEVRLSRPFMPRPPHRDDLDHWFRQRSRRTRRRALDGWLDDAVLDDEWPWGWRRRGD
jgi:ATP-dependent DNA helicase RecQ